MRLFRIAALLLIALLALYPPPARAQESDSGLVLMSSPEAPGTVSLAELRECRDIVAEELHVQGRPAPQILVFHVSRATAESLGTNSSLVSHGMFREEKLDYYELWIVGEPTLVKITVKMERILEDHFRVRLGDEERVRLQQRILKRMESLRGVTR